MSYLVTTFESHETPKIAQYSWVGFVQYDKASPRSLIWSDKDDFPANHY